MFEIYILSLLIMICISKWERGISVAEFILKDWHAVTLCNLWCFALGAVNLVTTNKRTIDFHALGVLGDHFLNDSIYHPSKCWVSLALWKIILIIRRQECEHCLALRGWRAKTDCLNFTKFRAENPSLTPRWIICRLHYTLRSLHLPYWFE